jgi:hypothetical protein
MSGEPHWATPARPATVVARVDFPEPVSPTTAKISPSTRSKLTPLTANSRSSGCRAGYRTDTSRAETTGARGEDTPLVCPMIGPQCASALRAIAHTRLASRDCRTSGAVTVAQLCGVVIRRARAACRFPLSPVRAEVGNTFRAPLQNRCAAVHRADPSFGAKDLDRREPWLFPGSRRQ